MTVSTTMREQQRLREVAREYRARGYEVIIPTLEASWTLLE